MKIRRHIISIISVLITALLCVSAITPAFASKEDITTVRLPYGYNDFLYLNDEGKACGLYADYLEKLAQIKSLKYEYIKTSWTDALEKLESGEIDIFFPANESTEKRDTIDFSSLPIGYTASGIFALPSSDYNYNDYSSFDGARIALSKNSSNEAEIENFSREHSFKYTPVYKETNDEIMKALENNEADLAVFSTANNFPGGILVSILETKPVYFAVRKGNNDLLDIVNDGMQILLKEYPGILTKTFKNTMIGSSESMSAYTAEEKDFIKEKTPINIGFYENTEPLAYIKEDGTYDGIYIELLKYIEEKSDINIVLHPINRDVSWKDLIKSGDIDFYIGTSNVIVANDPDIQMTNSFMEYANVLVTRNDCAFNQITKPVIALTYARSNWANYLNEHINKDLDIVYYKTAKECLFAVISGKADASLLNNLEFNYQSKNPRLSTLILLPQYRYPTEVNFSASKDIDKIKFSVLNKTIKLLDPDYVDVVTDECLSISYHSYSYSDTLYNSRYPLIFVGIIIVVTLIITFLTIMFKKRQKKIRAENDENERHHLQILAATSYDYSAVYYIDLDKNESEAVNLSQGLKEKLGIDYKPSKKIFSDAFKTFIDNYVTEEYKEQLLLWADPKVLIERFKTDPHFIVRYQIREDARNESYFAMHFVYVENDPNKHNMMVLGIRCIDETIKEEQQQKKILKDALDGANRANEAKSEFLSRMSHDIRTPMNAIVGMTAIAEAHINDPDRVKDSLQKITMASRHLLSLINDVLDMSKIEAGKMSLTEEDINLPELLDSLLNITMPQIKMHNHELNVHIQNVIHEKVIGDSLRIRQAFINLMGNAIKYTPDGGKITLTVREKEVNIPDIGCFEFVFEDNGIGMSEETMSQIFDPFSRAKNDQISKIQGTGLGLPLTRNIAQMMNGNVMVKSELGKGSEFTMTIFLKLQESDESDLSDLSGLHVLIVDDHEEARASISDILENIGIISECAASGEEALEKLKNSIDNSNHFYAAIVDWKMPGMNGLETAKAIKDIVGNNLPIIIISAYDVSQIEEEASEIGVNSFLTKPVFKSSIIRLFKQLKRNSQNKISFGEELESFEENSFSGRRILLVEDNELNREIAKEVLEMSDFTVEEAEDGKIASEMFSSSAKGYYDIILMDIQMPIMNGYEATRAIRSSSHPDAKNIPIIAMTANAFVEDIQESTRAGMNEHLAKPIDFEKLSDILKKYLN